MRSSERHASGRHALTHLAQNLKACEHRAVRLRAWCAPFAIARAFGAVETSERALRAYEKRAANESCTIVCHSFSSPFFSHIHLLTFSYSSVRDPPASAHV